MPTFISVIVSLLERLFFYCYVCLPDYLIAFLLFRPTVTPRVLGQRRQSSEESDVSFSFIFLSGSGVITGFLNNNECFRYKKYL